MNEKPSIPVDPSENRFKIKLFTSSVAAMFVGGATLVGLNIAFFIQHTTQKAIEVNLALQKILLLSAYVPIALPQCLTPGGELSMLKDPLVPSCQNMENMGVVVAGMVALTAIGVWRLTESYLSRNDNIPEDHSNL